MVQILNSQQDLVEVYNLIPYTVKTIDNPGQIEYPVAVKFVLLTEMNKELGVAEDVVYMVTFDAAELLSFFRSMVQDEREGIEGYKYAESKEEDETTDGGVQE